MNPTVEPTDSGRFAGKVAFVSGAGRGIGRSIALAFADAGADVAVNDLPSSPDLDDVVAACLAKGVRSVACPADLGVRADVDAAMDRAAAELGAVDVAVSNAAYSDRELFYEADLAGFEKTIQVTMWGAFHVVHAATRQMLKQGRGGAIVLISSTHAIRPIPGAMAYNMSKAAIEQLTKTAATELTEHGIRVNALRPGWVDTPGERKFFQEKTLLEMGSKLPQGRLETPDEVAHGVLFLADPASTAINGSILTVDGGIQLPVEQMYRLKQQPKKQDA